MRRCQRGMMVVSGSDLVVKKRVVLGYFRGV